jgi:hypothetical protein
MKYMIMLFGDQATMVETRSVEWIRSMIQFMERISDELRDAGELAAAEGLADPTQAITVRFENGVPIPTDGPFAEAKESLAGFWIVDVEKEDRAIEIASKVAAFIERPVEIRQVMDAPPEEFTS